MRCCCLKVWVCEGVMMVFGEVSGECTIRKSNSMGATTLSFLGETLLWLHLSMMQQAKK